MLAYLEGCKSNSAKYYESGQLQVMKILRHEGNINTKAGEYYNLGYNWDIWKILRLVN